MKKRPIQQNPDEPKSKTALSKSKIFVNPSFPEQWKAPEQTREGPLRAFSCCGTARPILVYPYALSIHTGQEWDQNEALSATKK
jgi:hypothetical protein